MYRERPSPLPGAAVWTKSPEPAPRPVLPDGCTDLIWYDGELLVAGPDTRAHLPRPPGRTPEAPVVGLRFAPGQGPAVFGVPAHVLRDLRVPLDELWPADEVRRLAGRLAAAGAPGRVLEAAAAGRLRTGAAPDPAGALIAGAAARGTPVRELAEAVGVGERQLHRRCLAAFGYGPKTLGRVLRLVRALELARAGLPYAEVAAVAGYADQAHLAREVKALAGAPLGAVLAPG
ncbi:AraC family transcriptional regulator [Streptomyces sp. Ru73]|uniref:AraC family transcriptional regulator n=1 Tax=Streptomyces sp. Ru73 TaxID=2080748 RepID=UPI000CDDF748|nr:helix-turn-helix domain-containing protein [Streptomyces sp. Ru73]POX36448.1 AraC family transcriptional regulator [Streptomyces sp. Ru73]